MKHPPSSKHGVENDAQGPDVGGSATVRLIHLKYPNNDFLMVSNERDLKTTQKYES